MKERERRTWREEQSWMERVRSARELTRLECLAQRHPGREGCANPRGLQGRRNDLRATH